MIQKSRGDFLLVYDPLSDSAELFHAALSGVVVARWEGAGCHVLHGPAWFEFETSKNSLRKCVTRLRALSGVAGDFFSEVVRAIAVDDLSRWDTSMKHGIWKCDKPDCKVCSGSIQQRIFSRPRSWKSTAPSPSN